MSIIIKCKMCGGTLEIKEGSTVAECEYCGTLQTLPKFSDEHVSNLYDRANHFRMAGEFDKAEGLYEQILSSCSEDAEAYWSLVLCKYGIIYVEDPTSHKRIPTVNRAQYTSIFDDANYKYAIEYADASQKEIYKAEATAINDIQKGILEISNKEEAFDVFICYKETDENGKRTKDSVLANDIYYQLTQEGLKVFFSKITLEDKLGTAYEPYIFSALNSAKVMVVVGTKPEYFNAVWVKNEWSRYLALIKTGQKKTLIPAYRDMDPYDLPEEFSHLQALDMSKIGFIQDLVRGIKKIVDKKESKKTETAEVKESKSVNSSVVAHLKRIKLFLEDEEWDKAEEYCEKVLEEDPECGRAYFYRFMAENQYSSTDDINLDYVFEEERDVKKALRFADPELKSQIQAIIYKQNKEEYDYAISCFNAGNYTDAISAFSNIEDFEDSKQQIEKCQKKIRENEMWKQYHIAVSQMQNGSYEEALKIFSTIPNFSDVNVKVFQCKEEIKKAEQKKIEDKYKLACTAMQNKDYSEAISIFNEVIGFQDSKAKIEECNQQIKKAAEKEKKFKRILLLVLLGALLIFAAYYFIGQTYWNKNESGHWHNLQEHEAHSYSLTVLTDSTCSQEGSGINTCTVCGYEQSVIINKKAHTPDDGVVTKESTCTEQGIKTYSCKVCGQTTRTQEIKLKDHILDAGVITKEPTCTEEGIKTYLCTVCGQAIKTETVAAKGHTSDSGKITKQPTCTQTGTKTYTCTVCGQVIKTETIATKSHTSDSGKITKQPTCIQTGTKTYSCTVCGQVITASTLPKTGTHTYVNYRCSGCGIWGKGPSGGYVFYDCDADNDSGNADGLISSDCGWRFLEAAPEDLSDEYIFGIYRTGSSYESTAKIGTDTAIGTGKINTEALVKAMGVTAINSYWGGKIKEVYAARACNDYEYTNVKTEIKYDDWFLPSKDELKLMYENLYKNGLGSFDGDEYYWSSSEGDSRYAWRRCFEYANLTGTYDRDDSFKVRPIRAFTTCSDGTSEHSWSSEIITPSASCISSGTKKYTCTICGQTKTEVYYAPHKKYWCSVCGLPSKGPAGGYVFYDCDADNDSGNADGLISTECGWRYLEAAPEDLSSKYMFGYYRNDSDKEAKSVGGTETKIGTGKANTETLIKAMGETAYKRDEKSDGSEKGEYAAKACADYSVSVDGVVYDDWFLPSKNELNLMYTNLHKNGVGSFASDDYGVYWSSSEHSGYPAWEQNFSSGNQNCNARGNNRHVRPVRAF